MNDLCHFFVAQYERFRTLNAYRNSDWRSLSIKESGERLVEVPSYLCHSFYCKEMQLTSDERIYLRESVLDKLLIAIKCASRHGYSLKVYDGWRSLTLQKTLFWYYMREFTAKKFPSAALFSCDSRDFNCIEEKFLELSTTLQSTMKEENRRYVSWPSSDPHSPSPHATGGSVDVWLYKEGSPVNLGVPFDWMEDDAGAFYHLRLRRNRFRGNDREVCRRRNLLLYVMTRAGFSCYGPEIWHFNYGNQMHALVTGKSAQYSYCEPR